MRTFRLKGLGLLLLLALLVLCSTIDVCDARRGKHWRPKRGTYSSSLRRKEKGKTGSARRQYGGNRPRLNPSGSPTPSPSNDKRDQSPNKPSPSSPVNTVPSPSYGKGYQNPNKPNTSPPISTMPRPSYGKGYQNPNKPRLSPPVGAMPNPGYGKGYQSPYKPSPSTRPSVPASPSQSQGYGKGHQSPKMPSPSCGKGYPSLPPPAQSEATIFNVVDFGAKGDGVTDDTKAFEAAWTAACKVEAATVLVPSELEFLVGPISFSGPYCKPNIVFQLEGTIVALTSAKAWGSGLLQWLEFTKLKGIAIQGTGVINGKGQAWWTYSDPDDDDDVDAYNMELDEKMPQIKPTALRFYGSFNVTVTGITIVNSSQCHLKFDNCEGVMVHNLTISSPEYSLNTDGIHLQNSKDVNIYHTNLACGDDCVSIQTGCSNINIHNVNCGPGHGISIGGLGRDNTKACVSNVTVRDVNMFKTMTGVRIKTWQGGLGLVQGIRFSNIQVSEVQTPIIIDQFYCDRTTCRNQTSAVAVSGVQYENIRGTFTVKPVHFACSDSSPCSEITLTGVQLKPLQVPQYHLYNPFCWQAYGELYTPTIPPIACLQIGKPASNKIQSDHDTC